MVNLDLRPGSRPASLWRRVASQTSFDVRNTLRNGENLLLTMVIPMAAAVLLLKTDFAGTRDPQEVLATVLSLAVLATAFTSQAISTGFDRRYGVLRMLGLSPLGANGLLLARILVSLCVIAVQTALLTLTVWLLSGWLPSQPAAVMQGAVAILLAVWAYTAWALVVAAALRAEATLAVANAIFLMLMFAGGLIVPREALPWSAITAWLPPAAVVDAMTWPPVAWSPLSVLVGWAAVGSVLATRLFRWQD